MSSHVLPDEVREIVGGEEEPNWQRTAERLLELEEETTDDGEYCHIVDDSGERAYCGRKQVGELTCKPYNGEAICPSCGLPTCPTCAVMQSLAERLEEAG